MSGHSAVAIALATVAAPYLGRRARRWVWAAAISVCVFRVYVGAHLPPRRGRGGRGAGAAAHLILGAPEGHVLLKRLRRALAGLGYEAVNVVPIGEPTRRSASFRVTLATGADVLVKIAARERRDDDLLYRGWKALRRRWIGRAHTGSAMRQVEHEACMGAMAAAAGVRTPGVLFAGPIGNGAGLLIQRWVPAARLDEVTVDAELLADVRQQVDAPHAAGIAHGDLHAGSVLVDADVQPWLVDFSRAEGGAGDDARAGDLTALRESLAALAPAPVGAAA